MPNQSRWPISRRVYYAEMMRQRRTWESAPSKTAQNAQAVKYNKLKSGRQAAPMLTVRKLLHQTNKLLKAVLGLYDESS